MSSLQAQEPVEWAVIGSCGATALLALAAALYSVPWRRGAAKDATRSFSVLWRGRAWLGVLCAAAAVSQLLRVNTLWGANSVVLPTGVTSWTGAGWMCRIYLTVALGLLQPLCAFTALLMLTAALSRRHRPETLRHPNARLLGLALLCTLPVAAVQAVVAWLGLVVQYQGQLIEAAPRSLLGIFFAAYWEGTPQQCSMAAGSGGGGSDAVPGGRAAAVASRGQPVMLAEAAPAGNVAAAEAGVVGGGCTACVFPAAAAIAHAVFTFAFLALLWVTSAHLATAVLNTRLKRRVHLFQLTVSLLAAAGLVALGISIVQGPFSWLNVGCWIAYVASVLLTVAVVVWEVAVWPVWELRAVDKRLALWANATTAALAAAADEALGSHPSGGSPGLIKAHNRSSEAEAYLAAAAAARTLSAARPPEAPPPRLALSLQPPPPQRQPALQRQRTLPQLVNSSPHRLPPLRLAHSMQAATPRQLSLAPQPLFTSAVPDAPSQQQQQLYP